MISTAPAPALDPVSILVSVADGLWAAVQDLSPQAIGVGVALLTMRLGMWLFRDAIAMRQDYSKVMGLYDRADREWEAGCYGQARSSFRSAERATARFERKWC